MSSAIQPVSKHRLPDDVAGRIKQLIDSGTYSPGDRLPTIAEMARQFGVGPPTLREALKKLETAGALDVRHGSGVYVAATHNTLMISNPVLATAPSKKTLLDLIETRILLEVELVSLAARNLSDAHIARMEALLAEAEEHISDDARLIATNMSFHREIAAASGNSVSEQLLAVLASLFRNEQQALLDIYGSRRKDHAEHVGIFEALKQRDGRLAADQMRAHLQGVREVILRWKEPDAAAMPVGSDGGS